jgi:hypothetical protein
VLFSKFRAVVRRACALLQEARLNNAVEEGAADESTMPVKYFRRLSLK